MTHRYWPLFDMRLASPDLTLRPMAEADLTAIAGLLPDDVEQDPAATTYPIGDDRISRGIVSCQHYWKAFGTLRARAAITSAWHDNHASLGVSRVLGYRPNGESLHSRGERADVMVHMRLQRADWLARGSASQIQISGFEACRPLFGLTAA